MNPLLKNLVVSVGLWILTSCSITPQAGRSISAPGDQCQFLTTSRNPYPPIDEKKLQLSGSIHKTPEGNLEVIINPLVWQGDPLRVLGRDPKNLKFTIDGIPAMPSIGGRIRADLVVAIDTTGSMFWAIQSVQKSLLQLTNAMETNGFDIQVGGIEFGDQLRSLHPMGPPAAIDPWLKSLSAQGGGDGPENPLDAMLLGLPNLNLRKGAQVALLIITDAGIHEKSDGDDCTQFNLSDFRDHYSGRTFTTVIYGNWLGTPPAGVHPRRLTQSTGGLFLEIMPKDGRLDFDLSSDLGLKNRWLQSKILTFPTEMASEGQHLEVRYAHQGETFIQEFDLRNPSP